MGPWYVLSPAHQAEVLDHATGGLVLVAKWSAMGSVV
jgi:hypothetical protein